ncbi:hypothetical protein [Phenylobacterium aquaticum]|uniref:hypothetical protein n=1 Tax=Phenylobacterium aquaticum TaxID=1763816 RepID=UPI0026ED5B26|nr:hypothetical protein [Phenylobacterium aquaticum]
MADGEHTLNLKVTLSALALRHLKDRAEKLGMTLDAAAADALEQQLFDYDDYDWGDDPENDPRTMTMAPYDPSEPTYSVEEVMAEFNAELEKRLAEKR